VQHYNIQTLAKHLIYQQTLYKETGVEDASVKLIAWNGYGDRNILFSILQQERPDAIFHFTDPRYWTWLYALEHEIKTTYATFHYLLFYLG
jgi:hypothetical protein